MIGNHGSIQPNERDQAMRGRAPSASATVIKIRHLATYLNDDALIASYLGCKVELVAYERSRLPTPNLDGLRKTAPEGPAPAGNEAAWRKACERGSLLLLEAYARYYERHVAGRAA